MNLLYSSSEVVLIKKCFSSIGKIVAYENYISHLFCREEKDFDILLTASIEIVENYLNLENIPSIIPRVSEREKSLLFFERLGKEEFRRCIFDWLSDYLKTNENDLLKASQQIYQKISPLIHGTIFESDDIEKVNSIIKYGFSNHQLLTTRLYVVLGEFMKFDYHHE